MLLFDVSYLSSFKPHDYLNLGQEKTFRTKTDFPFPAKH